MPPWGIDAIAERGGCSTVRFIFAHFEDNFTHGYSLGGWFGVGSRPELRPGGEKVEVGLLIDNEITFEPGVTYSLKEHGSRVVTHRAAKEIPMRITFAAARPDGSENSRAWLRHRIARLPPGWLDA